MPTKKTPWEESFGFFLIYIKQKINLLNKREKDVIERSSSKKAFQLHPALILKSNWASREVSMGPSSSSRGGTWGPAAKVILFLNGASAHHLEPQSKPPIENRISGRIFNRLLGLWVCLQLKYDLQSFDEGNVLFTSNTL